MILRRHSGEEDRPRRSEAQDRRRRDRTGDRVALRQLVIAASVHDVQLPAWVEILDRIGSPYDVVCADSEPIRRRMLVDDHGVGRYNAVLLTSAALLHEDDDGGFVSAFDAAAWTQLWEYERTFGVRQVALNAAPGPQPEDYGLRGLTEGPVPDDGVQVELTAAGAQVFDYLRPDARLRLVDAYVYRSRLDPDAAARALLTLDGDVVAAVSTSPDGRERLAVCFTVGTVQPVEELLGFGLVRWATRGVLLGEHRHWLNVDIDDWCDLDDIADEDWPSDLPTAGGSTASLARAQDRLRARHPLAAGLTMNLAYNAGGPEVWDLPLPLPPGPSRPGTGAGRPAPRESFRWVNHTFSHPSMETTSYEQNHAEIVENLAAAQARGLPVDPTVLKTPAYTGLGVLTGPDPSAGVLTDAGLEASNPELLAAARDSGVRYLHGNMSFLSHRPDVFNGGIVHPLQPDIVVVPDWPIAIPWWAGTPAEVEAGYEGMTPDGAQGGSEEACYRRILEVEVEEASRHLLRGSAYTHTLHRANTFEYAPGRSLATDWLDAVLDVYDAYYAVPLKTPDWTELARYTVARTAHTQLLLAGLDLTWERASGTVRGTAPADGSIFVTGAAPAAAATVGETEVYAGDHVLCLGVTAGDEILLVAKPRWGEQAGSTT